MKCPFCSDDDSKVIDSRPTDDGHAIRRRRECGACKNRFTTYEKVEEVPLVVVKKDGNREAFNRSKIMNGIIRACEKRPITLDEMEQICESIEKHLNNSMVKEIETQVIGEHIMEALKGLDEVAYVRFASVYRQFKDINTFVDELTKLMKEKRTP
ncbi:MULTISPECIES: transcriptional regulator NrdR [unclassified Fusibacter]|uniref:transcriptional regulator NrdR n=1 Tax=unclassified Fusibacter TaxID=2624464 RepID=UPI0010130DE0|nr:MULTISPECIES: transcriptional regulator NrdR [unclassified Fusibacter]MCK8058019.1 transcriptional regulator NrdR [Fusibacter sp. A2]NPE20601.1 transcriptional regulator NrdR [Fusibacter sp. A1]RXV62808.1 transcriptional regulator NrdR [Fusibacter sp. A1]